MSDWGSYPERPAGGPVGPAVGAQATLQSVLCQPCVLPSSIAHGRLDTMCVIGPALQVMASHPGAGAGAARVLGLPNTTVRD